MKKLFILLSVVVLLAVAGVFAAPHFISSEMIKAKLVQTVKEVTGQTLSIQGEAKVSIFPAVGVTLGQVKFATGLELKALDVHVEFWPLLQKKIVVKSLLLDEPNIQLTIDKSGKSNWNFSLPPQKPEAQLSFISTAHAAEGESGKGFDLSQLNDLNLSSVKIKNGTLDYRNQHTGDAWKMKEINAAATLESINAPLNLSGSVAWKAKTIKFNTEINNLKTISAAKPTTIKTKISSELLSLDTNGEFTSDVFTGKISVNSSSLRDVMLWMGDKKKSDILLPMALKLSASAICGKNQCALSDAIFNLDHISGHGDVKVNWAGSLPILNANIATNELDLNPFLPVEKKLGGYFVPSAFAQSWDDTPIDWSALRAINANLTVDAKGIRLHDFVASNAVLKSTLTNGKLSASMSDVGVYGGSATLAFNVDVTGAASFGQRLDIKAVQLEPLLTAINGSSRISGLAEGTISTTGYASSVAQIVSSLTGNGSILVTDGAIKGFNMAEIIRDAKSIIKPVQSSEAKKTDFSDMGGTFTIAQGLISNNDFMMRAPLLRVTGAGTINLPLYAINYRVTPKIVDTAKGQGGGDKIGLPIPLIVEGSLDNPTIMPDLASIVDEALKSPEAIKETVKDVKEEIKDATKNLKGLLKKF